MKKPDVSISFSSYDGRACLAPRTGATDTGAVAKPPGAPPPSSKGTIAYPKQVGK